MQREIRYIMYDIPQKVVITYSGVLEWGYPLGVSQFCTNLGLNWRTPSLTWFCTLTISLLSGSHQPNSLGYGSLKNLSWNLQVDHICKRARRTIGFIHLAFHSAPVSTGRILYLALVWPILEYGSTTWHSLNKSLTNRLESCQRFACRVVLQSWKASHEDLLSKSDLPLLSKRRDIATLCHLFKIVHDLCSSPNPFKPHPRPNLRNLNSCALDPPFCCLTLSQRSFYPYAPTLWNYLPEEIVQCKSLSSFKTAVHSHLV